MKTVTRLIAVFVIAAVCLLAQRPVGGNQIRGVSGTGPYLVTTDGNTLTNGHYVKINAAGDFVDSGNAGGVGGGDLVSTNNLSDITSAASARSNLGLVIGTNVLAPNGSAASLTSFPTLNQDTTGTAAKATILATTRAIYGNNFDGSAALTSAIATTYGGLGAALNAAAAHSTIISNGATPAVYSAKVIPNCTDTGGNHLNFTQSTDAFSCGTSGGSGGGVSSVGGQTGAITVSNGIQLVGSDVQFDSTVLAGAYPTIAGPNVFTPGGLNSFAPSLTTGGFRLVPTADPSSPVAGVCNFDLSSNFHCWTGSVWAGNGITALTSDVTASGSGSVAATIANGAVTLAKMANIATATLIGRTTAGTGVPEALTVLPAALEPAHTGDATNSAGSLAMTVVKINGTLMSGLATGILKNTTGTGVPSIAAVGTDYGTPDATTKTLTNTTYDAEGTGNVLTVPAKIWLPAGGCQNTTALSFWDLPTSTPAAAACITGTNTQKGVLDYADTSGGFSAQSEIQLPADFSGAIDAKIIWLTSATSGNAKWSLSTICTDTAASATDDPSFNTASTVTTAAPGTANRLQASAITGVTATGCAANGYLHLKLFRDGNDGSDTLGATARFLGLELTVRRAM